MSPAQASAQTPAQTSPEAAELRKAHPDLEALIRSWIESALRDRLTRHPLVEIQGKENADGCASGQADTVVVTRSDTRSDANRIPPDKTLELPVARRDVSPGHVRIALKNKEWRLREPWRWPGFHTPRRRRSPFSFPPAHTGKPTNSRSRSVSRPASSNSRPRLRRPIPSEKSSSAGAPAPAPPTFRPSGFLRSAAGSRSVRRPVSSKALPIAEKRSSPPSCAAPRPSSTSSNPPP